MGHNKNKTSQKRKTKISQVSLPISKKEIR